MKGLGETHWDTRTCHCGATMGPIHRQFQLIIAHVLSILMLQWSMCAAADENILEYYVQEETAENTGIGDVIRHSGLNQKYSHDKLDQLRFKFLTRPGPDRDFFHIGEISSRIRTKVKIDRDQVCPQQEVCMANYDVAVMPQPFFQIIKVQIEIMDINDNEPAFPQHRITHQISESAVSGTNFVIPAAYDPDSGDNGIQRYGLFPESRKFDIKVRSTADGATDLRLMLKGKLDRERNDFYELTVVAMDGGKPAKSGSIALDVYVIDANDNDPQFDNETYEVSVRENIPLGTNIMRVTAHDLDKGANAEISYEFSENTEREYGKLFGINRHSGEIYVRGDLDFEAGVIYLLSLVARDGGPDSLPASATAVVHVLDVNDNAPEISVNTMTQDGTAQVAENAKTESFVAHISVIDTDSGDNCKFTCSIDTRQFTLVELSETHFKLVTANVFDREFRSEYGVALTCRDHGVPPRQSATQILVEIQDVNDHAPDFLADSYSAIVQEHNDAGVALLSVSAIDEDSGANGEVTYTLNEEARQYLHIDPYTGLITARVIFDHEQIQELLFLITARDGGNPSQDTVVSARLQIMDLNDERPMFLQDSYNFGVYENQSPNTLVGNVSAIDKDWPPFNTFTYHLHQDSGDAMRHFKIDQTLGKIYTTVKLDRERQSIYYLIVMAKPKNDPYFTSTVSVTVRVEDENDNYPVLTFPTQGNNTILVSSLAPVGHVISRVMAHDFDVGENGRLSYLITEGNQGNTFSVDVNNGAIAVNTDISLVIREEFTLSLYVQDNGVPQYSETGTLKITIRGDLPFYYEEQSTFLSEENLTIVLVFALATVCVAIVIIVAIVVIVRKKSRNGHQKVEKEKQMMLCPGEGDEAPGGAAGGKIAATPNTYASVHDDLDRTRSPQMNHKSPPPPPPDSSKPNGYLKVDLRMEGLHGKQHGGGGGGESDLPPPPSSWVTTSPGTGPITSSSSGGFVSPRQTSGSVHSGSSAETLLRPSSRDGSGCGGHGGPGSEGRNSPLEKQMSPSHLPAKPVVAFIRDQAETEPCTESDSAGSGLSTSDSGRGHSSEEGEVAMQRVGHGPAAPGTGHQHLGADDMQATLHPELGLKHPRTDTARRTRSPVMRVSTSPPCSALPANGGPHRDMLMRELCDTISKSPKLEKGHIDTRSLDRSGKRMPSSNLHVRFAPNRHHDNGGTLPGDRLYHSHGNDDFDLPIHTERMSGHSGDYFMYDSVDSAV